MVDEPKYETWRVHYECKEILEKFLIYDEEGYTQEDIDNAKIDAEIVLFPESTYDKHTWAEVRKAWGALSQEQKDAIVSAEDKIINGGL